ncbi:MAG: ROK family protein [Sphaerochaetaceae bacterium]
MILGIDVGATKIAIASFDAPGNIIEMESFPSRRSGEGNDSIQKTLYLAYRSFVEKYPHAYDGIGIGVVGHTDPAHGIWLRSSNLSLEYSLRIHDVFDLHPGIPIRIDNDVNAATLAEQALGKGSMYKHFIYVNLGSGIAAGLISGGRLIRGSANYAGELAYLKLSYQGEIESLESVVSGLGIRDFLIKHRFAFSQDPALQQYSAAVLFRLAEQGDPLASQQIEKIQTMLFLAIHNLVNVLNPEAVIFGGSLAKESKLLDSVERQLRRELLPIPSSSLHFVGRSELGVSTVGILGAAQLAFNEIKQ